MQPIEEQARRRLLEQWLRKAETDLQAAQALLSHAPPLLYPSCFHAQQAAEKYLKAFLTWHQVEFPYGVVVRYPGDQPEPDSAEAAEALSLAWRVRDAVLAALPSA